MTDLNQTATVVVKGETSGVTQKLKEVADGTERVKRASEAAGAAQSKWGDKLDAIDGRMRKFSDGIGKVTGLLSAGGLVGMVTSAASALGQMAERAAQVSLATQALRISIGPARAATMGLVTDYNLTIAANKAMQLGVVKSAEEFAKLTQTAVKLGAAVGKDATSSIETWTEALHKGEAEAMGQLGVVVDVEAAITSYASSMGKTSEALTDLERKQAIASAGVAAAEDVIVRTGVSLDNHAVKLHATKVAWENLADTVMWAASTTLSVGIEVLGDLGASLGETAVSMGESFEPWTDAVVRSRMEIERQTQALFDQADAMATASLAADEAFDKEQARLAKTEYGPELPPDWWLTGGKTPGKGKGTPRPTADATDRFLDQTAGIEASNQISASIEIEANNEAMARELELRQERIDLLTFEQELATQRMDAGLFEADQVEELARRKYEAEMELLDWQLEAANTRAEILDFEATRRRMATQEQQRMMASAQASEIKSLQARQAKYEGYAESVSGALSSIAQGAIAAAQGEEYAGRRALAALATSIRDQMILTSLKEFALAVASAASFNFVGAGAHAAAGAQAAIVAAAAGGAGAAINASIPSEPDISTTTTSSDTGRSGGRGGRGSSGGGGGGGGGDDDGVPTSYYDGGLYVKRPDRSPQSANASGKGAVVININSPIYGTDKVSVGKELKRLIDDADQQIGRVGGR